MIALYIIAGIFLGFFTTGLIGMITQKGDTTQFAGRLMMAFVGGVGGHLLFNLVYT